MDSYFCKAWNGTSVKKRFFESYDDAHKFLKKSMIQCLKKGFDFKEYIEESPLFQIFTIDEAATHLFEEGDHPFDPRRKPIIPDLKKESQ